MWHYKENKKNQKAKSAQYSSKRAYQEAAVLVKTLNCFLKAYHSYYAAHYKCKYMTYKKFSMQNNPVSSSHSSMPFTQVSVKLWYICLQSVYCHIGKFWQS